MAVAASLCVGQAWGDTLIGTATFLNKNGDLLTNRHVVDGCKSLLVRSRDDKLYEASIIAQSSKFDLAVIETSPVPEAQEVTLAVNAQRYVYIPTPGMKLLYGGFDTDPVPVPRVGISNGEAVGKDEGLYISRMRSGANHGASGSGVFDYSGNMVGVIFSGYINHYGHTTDYYGDNLINFYNNNAVAEFLQKELSIELSYSVHPPTLSRLEVVGKIFNTTALVVCRQGENRPQ